MVELGVSQKTPTNWNMSVFAYDSETGRVEKSADLQLANMLLKAKKTKSPWDVITLIIKAWKKKNPKKWKSYVIRLEEVRQSQKTTWVGNKEFRGVSKDKKNDAYLAHTVDFPVWLMMAIRKLYDHTELQMDKKFFREFGARFPEFRIMETV